MESWAVNDFVYAIDSDVIFHGFESDWHNQEENKDLIFFERWWNGEIVAGKFNSCLLTHIGPWVHAHQDLIYF